MTTDAFHDSEPVADWAFLNKRPKPKPQKKTQNGPKQRPTTGLQVVGDPDDHQPGFGEKVPGD